MDFKKIKLSFAAAGLLCGVSLFSSATTSYVPITTDANDNSWKLFGVNGFSKDIITPAVTASWGAGFTSLSDAKTAAGTQGWLDGTDAMATLRLLSSASESTIEIRADISDNSYDATESTRSIYIAAPGGTTPIAKLDYVASLEGESVDLQLDGAGTIYTFTINADNSYTNPVAPTAKVSSAAVYGAENTLITNILDYDLSNNPVDPVNFDSSTDLDSIPGTITARIYRYDTANGIWELWDNKNDSTANDFNNLEKSRAYWIKIDDGDDTNANANNAAGLILGNDGVASTDYTLSEGWNLISFDDTNKYIRKSMTGLILTDDNTNGNLKIFDATGTYTVTVVLGGTTQESAKNINVAIENAKELGDFPEDFQLRAFRKDATDIVLVSNQKFIINDDGADDISTVTTLTGGPVWSIADRKLETITDLGVQTTATTDDAASGVASVYGEYALVIEPLVGTNTASDLDSVVTGGDTYSAAIMINSDNNQIIPFADDDTTTTLTTANTKINAAITAGTTDLKKAIEIDIDFDGTNDHLLLASDENFNIRDNTFTKVFAFSNTNADGTLTYNIKGATPATPATAPSGGDTVDLIKDDVNDKVGTTKVYSALNDGGGTPDKLIVISASQANLDLIDSDGEFFTDSTVLSSDANYNLTKGAVKAVYDPVSLSHSAIVQNKIEDPIDVSDTVADGDTITIELNSHTTTYTVSTSDNSAVDTPAEKLVVYDAIVDAFNSLATTNGIYGVATHDYDTITNNHVAAKITITGYNLDASNIDITDTTTGANITEGPAADANSADIGKVTLPSPLVSDLTYNSINVPDFPEDGPLYTLKSLGYDIKAIATGTTDMSATSTTWSNLDLTAPKNIWYADQDFDLFNLYGKTGYWAYLTAGTASTITSTLNNLNKSYTHRFNALNETNNFIELGGIDVSLAGISDHSIFNVYVTINGVEYELLQDGSTDVYNGYIGRFASNENGGATSKDIMLRATDGVGSTLATTSLGTLDTVEPDAPTATIGDGSNIAISSTDADVAGYYVYDTYVPELDTETNKLAYTSGATATLNICEQTTLSPTFGSAVNPLKIFAVDGGGTLATGLASNTVEIAPHPILLGSNVLTSTGTSTTASVGYNSICQTDATKDGDKGIQLKSKQSGVEVKLAFVAKDDATSMSSGISGTPESMYLKIDGTDASDVVAQILFDEIYNGESFYVNVGGIVYLTTFDKSKSTEDTALRLDTTATVITGQTF